MRKRQYWSDFYFLPSNLNRIISIDMGEVWVEKDWRASSGIRFGHIKLEMSIRVLNRDDM